MGYRGRVFSNRRERLSDRPSDGKWSGVGFIIQTLTVALVEARREDLCHESVDVHLGQLHRVSLGDLCR